MSSKLAIVSAHQFNCLPGHVQISAHGVGSNRRVALRRAIYALLKEKRLSHRKLERFRIDVVISEVGNS